ncbi:MAG: ABC transporter substrate-binding protein, partial [Chloroflexota bacterium]|nr:ABC transporter substrate-binding protein [Chloroflexota bacterium]
APSAAAAAPSASARPAAGPAASPAASPAPTTAAATKPTANLAAAAGPPEVKQIEIWAVKDPQEAAQIALADTLGYYKDEGLDVTVKWIVSGTDMPSLAASGQVTFYGEGNFTAAILRDKDVDMRYVMRTADISGTQSFVLGPNAKVASPKDLEGKKVGMAAGSGVSVAIANMAKQYGVAYDKIQFVNLQPPDQAPALIRGDIDAMAVWEPWSVAGRKLGGKLFFTGNRSFIDGTEKPVSWLYLDSGINVKGDFMDKNPNTVKAVLRAIIRATDYINTNPIETSATVLSKSLEVPADDLATIMKENIYSNEWDQRAVDGSNEFIAWGADLKYVSKPADVKEVVDFRYVKDLAPDKIKAAGY